jgi:hypothetical protein
LLLTIFAGQDPVRVADVRIGLVEIEIYILLAFFGSAERRSAASVSVQLIDAFGVLTRLSSKTGSEGGIPPLGWAKSIVITEMLKGPSMAGFGALKFAAAVQIEAKTRNHIAEQKLKGGLRTLGPRGTETEGFLIICGRCFFGNRAHADQFPRRPDFRSASGGRQKKKPHPG